MLKHKLICLLLICALTLGCGLPAYGINGYSDVPEGSWYYTYVTDLSQTAVVNGYPDGTFRPDGTVTWGEALKLILRAVGFPETPQIDNHWASGYLGLAIGYGFLPETGEYPLDLPITRLEVARLAARAMGLYNTLMQSPFADCADSDVLALYGAGIIQGMEINGQMCFAGDRSLLRSQISAIIWRIQKYQPGDSGGGLTPGVDAETPEIPETEQPSDGPGLTLEGWQPLPPVEETPETVLPPEIQEPPVQEPPKTITYGNDTVNVLEDVPVFAYDPQSFYLKNGRMHCSDDRVKLVHGIDVSAHQGAIDWDKVRSDGVDFAILRAAYRGYTAGSLNRDTMFDLNIHGASRAGLDVGVYIFSQAISVEEAIEEADYLLEIIAPYEITGPVVFDWEVIGTKNARTYGLDTETLCAAANAFCQRIAEAGYTPMVYFNPYCGYVKYDLSEIMDYDFWFAQYKNQPDFYYNFQIWQYTSSGRVDGIQGNVDLDVWLLPEE